MNRFFRYCMLVICLVILCGTLFCFADETPVKELYRDPATLVLRVSPSDTSGLHAIMLSLIGDYNPIVKDYTYQTQQGYTQHSIDIEPDWSWIATCVIFALVFFCFMQFIGKLFSR